MTSVHAAYLAAVPEPEALDFGCPRCRAVVGQQCRGMQPHHCHGERLGRRDRARTQWLLGPGRAEDAAAILTANTTGPAAHRARQLTKPQRAALLIAAGWHPIDTRSANAWRSPDPDDQASWSLGAAMRELLAAWPW